MNTKLQLKLPLVLGILLFASLGKTLVQAPVQAPKRIRIACTMPQLKPVHQVGPAYPRAAKAAGIQGTVRLEIVIGRDGSVLEVKLLRGHPMLAKAAMKAVSKWQYKPTLLNEKPVEVVTQVDVNFMLPGK